MLRSARSGEEDELAQVAFRAFRVGTEEGWASYYREHSAMTPEDVVVVEDGRGGLAGHAAALRLTMTLGGVDVPVRGIAAVAVSPEHRRRGVAERLLTEILARMRRRREGIAMLYAFRLSFYGKFGFGLCEAWDHVRCAPRQLPRSDLRRHVRRARLPDDDAGIRRVYEVSRAGTSGQVARSDYWWERRVYKRAPEAVVWEDPRSRRVDGYLLYEVPAAPPYPEQQVTAYELRAVTPDAHRGLWGYLEALGEQYRTVDAMLPRGAATTWIRDFGLADATALSRHHDHLGYVHAGAMARLVDLGAAFALHPGPRRGGARGRLGLTVEDPVFPRAREFDVTFGAAGARVAAGRTARERIALPIDRLTQVYFGAARASVLLAQGHAAGSARAADLLDHAFAGPTLYLGPGNRF